MKMDAKFIKIRSKKDITISIATVVVGLLLALLPFGSGIKCLGWFIAVTGVVLILALKTSWKNVDDCTVYKKKEYFIDMIKKASTIKALENDLASIDLEYEDAVNELRLDVYYSYKAGKVYAQLFEFVPFNYKAVTSLLSYNLTDAQILIK